MPQSGVHVALPEVLAEAQPHREIEHHVDVGARLATRRHQRGPQLDPLAGSLIDAETDAQTFAFPGARDRRTMSANCAVGVR